MPCKKVMDWPCKTTLFVLPSDLAFSNTGNRAEMIKLEKDFIDGSFTPFAGK